MKLLLCIGLLISFQAQAGVLNNLVKESKISTQPKIFIFDLDETLIDSTPRRYVATRQAIEFACNIFSPPMRSGFIEEPRCEDYRRVSLYDLYKLKNRYQISYALKALETAPVYEMDLLPLITEKSLKIYLSGNHLELDTAYLGAVSFIQDLKKVGAEIFFVSSRSLEKQNKGTRESLKKLGLIDDVADDHVILKSDSQSSIDFKTKTFKKIKTIAVRKNAKILGVFENEPENMNAMLRLFPEAQAVFVSGAFIKDVPIEGKPHFINDYLEYNESNLQEISQ